VPADHRENALGVRVVQARYGLENLIRLLEPAEPPEFREVEGERLPTEIKVTKRAERIGDQPAFPRRRLVHDFTGAWSRLATLPEDEV
jgi:hypothetical protein